ncbi:MAG: hypothetical protein CFE39_02320 [Comamonadaceae bacterium PBBC2]|jgi:hypothetical protein|nr:MAG: hypothetical protein CFE39_02320 [Comamonadaceae bacterium PBBC2]
MKATLLYFGTNATRYADPYIHDGCEAFSISRVDSPSWQATVTEIREAAHSTLVCSCEDMIKC